MQHTITSWKSVKTKWWFWKGNIFFAVLRIFEQMELLRGIVNTVGIYKLLNTKEEWVTLDELTEISSQVIN